MLDTNIFSNWLLPISLGLLMFSMGLSLTFNDFGKIFRFPKALFLGLSMQMLFLPAVAFALVALCPLALEFKLGILLVAFCPGGATSNMINYLLRGNLALVVSLTAVNSLLTQFTIPLLLSASFIVLAAGGQIAGQVELEFFHMVKEIFLITLLPTIIGILLRRQFPETAKKSQPILKVIMPSLLTIAIIGSIFLESTEGFIIEWQTYLSVLPWVLAMHLISMIGAYQISRRLAKLSISTSMSIGIEVGLQNTALALTIALTMLESKAMSVPATVYALFSFFTTLIFGMIVSGRRVEVDDVILGKKSK